VKRRRRIVLAQQGCPDKIARRQATPHTAPPANWQGTDWSALQREVCTPSTYGTTCVFTLHLTGVERPR